LDVEAGVALLAVAIGFTKWAGRICTATRVSASRVIGRG
jgi:hypothetical protein